MLSLSAVLYIENEEKSKRRGTVTNPVYSQPYLCLLKTEDISSLGHMIERLKNKRESDENSGRE